MDHLDPSAALPLPLSLPLPSPKLPQPWPSLADSLHLHHAAPARPDAAPDRLKASEPRIASPPIGHERLVAATPQPQRAQPPGSGMPAHPQDRDNAIAPADHGDSTLTLTLVSAADALKLPAPCPNDLPRHLRDAAIWSSRISPVLESLQAFASLALSLTSVPDSRHLALILQPQVGRLTHLIDSLLGTLFNPTSSGGTINNSLDLLVTPAAIRKAAAQAAVSPVSVPLANVWHQYLVQDVKRVLEWVASSAEADCVKIQQEFHRSLEQRQQSERDVELPSEEVPDHERAHLGVDVALAADEPAPARSDSVDVQADSHEQIATIVDPPATTPNSDSNLKNTLAPVVCDSPRPVTPIAAVDGDAPSTHIDQPSIPNAPSPEALTALSQVYTHLHQTCLSALARLTSLQPPPTLRADLESEIYRARLEHVLWNMYLGQSGGMLSAALGQQHEPTSPLTGAPVLNVMPTLTQVVAPPQAPPQPLVLTRSRIPVPVRHVVVPAPATRAVKPSRRRHRADSVASGSEDEHIHVDSEYASDLDTDTGEIYQDDDEYHEPEPPRGKVIRGGGGGGSISLKLPKPNPMFMVPARPRANTLDTIPGTPVTSTRKPRAPTRAPLTQPPWSISSAGRPRSTSTNASTSTFGGARVRPRVSSHRESLRSPSPSSSRLRPPPHLLHSPTSPTLRTLSRPASTPSLLAAMANSPSTPSLGSTYGGAPGFFPPFIPAGNLGLGDSDVANQRVYNRLSSWHVSGKEADKIAERQAVYEERFRAAAFAAVAANRMAGAGGGRERGAAAASAGVVRDHGDGDEQLHVLVGADLLEVEQEPAEVPAAEEHHLASGAHSRAVSPALGGVVRGMVEQIEQIQIGDEERHQQASHTSDD